jgi:uncharacterized protein (DUF2252 family)
LAASAVVAGRENGLADEVNRKLAKAVSKGYRWLIRHLAEMPALDVWYYQVEADDVLEALEHASKQAKKSARKMVTRARSRTHAQTLDKLTEVVDGRRRILHDPPLLVRLSEVVSEEESATEQEAEKLWKSYMDSLPEERRLLVSQYRMADGALRVGGVGSVGTRCTIFLLQGGAQEDALILQQKEAGASVLEPYVTKQDYASEAKRVVIGQRLMKAASDIFLGWHESPLTGLHYYWRQLKDMKGLVDVTTLDEAGLETYLAVCSACLARAHARTGDAAGIAGYVGKKEALDSAMADFAVAYADQTERDHQALVDAVASGRIAVETGM